MEQYTVTGMSCAACSARVEKAVSAVPGVTSCSVSLLTNSMGVEGTASAQAVVSAVQAAGYGASLKGASSVPTAAAQEDALADRETPALKRRLIASLGFLIALMYVSMGHMMWGWPLPACLAGNHVAMGLLQLLLTIAVMVINQKFFINGFRSLLHGAPNMDTLVALGAAASFGYSTYALFAMTGAQVRGDAVAVMRYMHEFYFESAAMILALITVGKMLEARSKGKTTGAITALLALAPESAVVRRDGKEVTVPTEDIKAGETVIVRQGGRIPVDGTVTAGSGTVDESALTGESMPVEKTVGGKAVSATILTGGYLELTADRVGADTTLSQIIQLMEQAASGKAPISRLADKISAVFVPVVISIALLAAILWAAVGGMGVRFCLSIAIAVLVISCPCALGLATPVAITVATGKAAEQGILVKSAASLELMGRVDTVVLDKTGTVTEGKPRVTDLLCAGGMTEDTLLSAAASLEKPSEHPLAGAIVAEAEKRGLVLRPVSGFAAVAGGGVTARAEGTLLLAGNEAFMETSGVAVSEEMKSGAARLAEDGKTPLFIAAGTSLLGVIAVADVVKADSAAAIAALREMGCDVVLLTGDNQRTADAIARQVGVSRVIAQVLPQDKARVVQELQAEGKRVAMVGDGINDAPALVTADVGLAIGAGTDVAIESADIVLMKSSLMDIADAAALSRATLRNIRQNLFWAFFYNSVGIPVAAGVLYPAFGITLNPMIAAAAMSLSSVCVVSNALRLRGWRGRRREETPASKKPQPVQNINNNESSKEDTAMKKTITIKGMMCAHCVSHVEKALTALGVQADVDLASGTAVVTGNASDEALKKAVADAGYEVVEIK